MNTSINKNVGTYLKSLRQEQRLTQGALALRCKEPQSFVSKVECGTRSLCLYELFSYAEALGVDPSTLYKGVVHHIANQADQVESAE